MAGGEVSTWTTTYNSRVPSQIARGGPGCNPQVPRLSLCRSWALTVAYLDSNFGRWSLSTAIAALSSHPIAHATLLSIFRGWCDLYWRSLWQACLSRSWSRLWSVRCAPRSSSPMGHFAPSVSIRRIWDRRDSANLLVSTAWLRHIFLPLCQCWHCSVGLWRGESALATRPHFRGKLRRRIACRPARNLHPRDSILYPASSGGPSRARYCRPVTLVRRCSSLRVW